MGVWAALPEARAIAGDLMRPGARVDWPPSHAGAQPFRSPRLAPLTSKGLRAAGLPTEKERDSHAFVGGIAESGESGESASRANRASRARPSASAWRAPGRPSASRRRCRVCRWGDHLVAGNPLGPQTGCSPGSICPSPVPALPALSPNGFLLQGGSAFPESTWGPDYFATVVLGDFVAGPGPSGRSGLRRFAVAGLAQCCRHRR